MPMANYKSGFAHGVSIRGIPLLSAYPGDVYWVDGNAGNNDGSGVFQRPFATIDEAVGHCTAGKGDIIAVKAGHVETISAAGLLELDVAGTCILGFGAGDNRPTINFTTVVGADMNVDAANISMVNILFTGGFDALTGPIDVNSNDFSLVNCEFRDVTGQATDVIVADANSHRLLIDGYFHNGAAVAGANAAIALTGMTNPEIRNFKIVGNFANAAIECRTTAVVDVDIHDGYIWNKNSADVGIKDTVTGSTGKIGSNINIMMTDNAANITEAVTGATFHMFLPVNACNLAGEVAMTINWVASTDA